MRISPTTACAALVIVANVACRGNANAEGSGGQAESLGDSAVTTTIRPAGGTVELAGFAVVTFPPGSFTEPRNVTVEATSETTERKIFRYGHEADPTEHEIRVTTGEAAPDSGIHVGLLVPRDYVRSLPSDRSPAVYVREITGGPLERIDEYVRYPSRFDPQKRTVEAEVPVSAFSQYRFAGKYEAVIMIGSG